MGSSQSMEFKSSLASLDSSYQSDCSSPLRKRPRFPKKSLSLNSLKSLGKNVHLSKKLFGGFNSSGKKSEPMISTFPRGKRKHDKISTNAFALQDDYKMLRHESFLPEFPFRDDICISDFNILNTIGNGTFGNVMRACWTNRDFSTVAIKVQNKNQVVGREAEKQIKSEATLHKTLPSHNFIVRFIDCWQTSTSLYTVLEYVNGYGDLYTLWNDYGCMPEDATRIYAAEIALALGIVYRDLKMENLVLDMDMHVKLVDFGFAKFVANNRTNTICGTLQYMAPEIAVGELYGISVDWWSYGTILYILSTGQYPYPNSHATKHTDLVFDVYKTPEEMSQIFRNLLEELLDVDVRHRLSVFQDVVGHSFFDPISFEDVCNKRYNPWEPIKKSLDFTMSTHSTFNESNTGFLELVNESCDKFPTESDSTYVLKMNGKKAGTKKSGGFMYQKYRFR